MPAPIRFSHTFLQAITGSAGGPRWSNPYPADRFGGDQARTFWVSQNASDTVTIQGTSNFEVTAGTVWATVTAMTGQATASITTEDVFGCIRVGITGANGACTVTGQV